MVINKPAFHAVFVTTGDGPALMGRNWLSVLRLNRKQIKQISLEPRDRVESLVSKYASPFDGGLGTIKGVTAHLKLKENATPQFFKARPVPFALKEKIAEELKRGWRESECYRRWNYQIGLRLSCQS